MVCASQESWWYIGKAQRRELAWSAPLMCGEIDAGWCETIQFFFSRPLTPRAATSRYLSPFRAAFGP